MIAEAPEAMWLTPLPDEPRKPKPARLTECVGCSIKRWDVATVWIDGEPRKLCPKCTEAELRRHNDQLSVGLRSYRYPKQPSLESDTVDLGDTQEVIKPPNLNPEFGNHLMPSEMAEDAPTGSPLGMTPDRRLINWIMARQLGAVDQVMAEQMMDDERHDLWVVWVHAKHLTDADTATRLGLSPRTVKRIVREAVRFLHAHVNFGPVKRKS